MAYSFRILVVLVVLVAHSTLALAVRRCGEEYDAIAGKEEIPPESSSADVEGLARFGHLASMADFLTEMGLPSPFVDARHMGIEASGRSNEEKAQAQAALYADYQQKLDAFFAANVEDPRFRDAAGKILKDYYNHPPLSSTGDFELPGWFDIAGRQRPQRVENWEDLFRKESYGSPWDIAMNTVKNVDGFKDVLWTPRYADPAVRLDTLSRMQYGYALHSLSKHLQDDLLRRTEFEHAEGQVDEVISDRQTPDRVDIP
ncbi:MAG: hypothetical protein H6617_04830 [Bdellovibrionaceae bacterium]|nr:hypothetical protein [Bdellovibrionales bacterium]MCB9253987.1 hypothetical protein [Pseudobdellovibrionaceae bacterium]